MQDDWLDRLTDGFIDTDIVSLLVLLGAFAAAVVGGHIYFRWRLEPAVTDGIAPRTVRLEALAFALATGALIAAFSGWGFLWVAGLLALALILALVANARRLLGVIVFVILLAVLVTVAGLKLG